MVTQDKACRDLAARTVREHTEKLIQELQGVRNPDDLERVHQSRVAARRLRVALRLFGGCWPDRKVKKWRAAARRLLKALGPARDKDVQIAFVRGVRADVDDRRVRPGVARLLLRLEQARADLQPAVVKAAERFERSGVAENLLDEADALLDGNDDTCAPVPGPAVFREAGRELLQQAEQLLAVQDCLEDPSAAERHHAMRIAAKKLRYTMSALAPLYEGELDAAIAAAKRLQDLLGELHDCDVWRQHLADFLKDERQRTVSYFGTAAPMRLIRPGIDFIIDQRAAERQRLFGELVDFWKTLNQQRLWGDLMQTVATRAAPRGPAEPASEAVAEPASEAAADPAAEAAANPAAEASPEMPLGAAGS